VTLVDTLLTIVLVVIFAAAIIGAAVWFTPPPRGPTGRKPHPPFRGQCVDGTNCRAFLPHNIVDRQIDSPAPPPMCATCPYAQRST
jgi:hypothetical protein